MNSLTRALSGLLAINLVLPAMAAGASVQRHFVGLAGAKPDAEHLATEGELPRQGTLHAPAGSASHS
ncbi:MAG: hypothetical protein WD534_02590 [Phycisphaeraceae bacterium]